MYRIASFAIIVGSVALASCTSSLEQIVEARHQAKIEEAIANRPITRGAADGLGAAIADSSPDGITLSTRSVRNSQ